MQGSKVDRIAKNRASREHLSLFKYTASDLGFSHSSVSRNALEVVEKLQKKGFDGYLVGGCVRDLVLGIAPKDYDVTTNAKPEQVKAIFPRSRIIGRRFKIVHVTYGRGREAEIIEVATYRANSQVGQPRKKHGRSTATHSGRILDDNVYGTLEEDVERRDLTVNSLYYDPVKEIVLDYCGGVDDLRKKEIHVIGNISTRFSEDPVRMLRAIRFKAKLGLKTGEELDQHINTHAHKLADVPAARLFDEVLKLFHHGAALQTWKTLHQTPLGGMLFPLTSQATSEKSGHRFEELIVHALKNTDSRINRGLPVMAGFLYAVLLWRPYNLEVEKLIKRGEPRSEAFFISAADSVFKRQNRVISIPWRVRTPATEVWDLQSRLERRAPKTILKTLDNRRFRAAYDFLELRSRVDEVDKDIVDWWTKIQEVSFPEQQKMIDVLRNSPIARKESETNDPKTFKKKPRRRRYRGKKKVAVNASSGS